jgi:hypothetical protein
MFNALPSTQFPKPPKYPNLGINPMDLISIFYNFRMKYPRHLIMDVNSLTFDNKTTLTGNSFYTAFRKPLNFKPNHPLMRHGTLNYSPHNSINPTTRVRHNITNPLFDIHFIQKEKIYTKLKYSRCPQYDIVSGGFAAILAGFIGFLISEKFGIELVDSGDFYIAFMYVVFITFSVRPLIRIYSKDTLLYTPVSFKYPLSFSREIALLVILEIKYLGKKIVRFFPAI